MGASRLTERPALVARMSAWLERSQERQAPYATTVLGETFVVQPGVFSPHYYPETAFYARAVVDLLVPGTRYLDVGCGVGVTTVLAAKRGVDVTAADINPLAIDNTRLNCDLHGLPSVDIRISDVFSAIGSNETYETVFWNIPFAYRRRIRRLSMLEEAIFDPGFKKHRDFLRGASSHVTPGGQLLVGLSPSLGDVAAVRRIAAEAGVSLEMIAETDEGITEEPTMLGLYRGTFT